MIYCSNCGVKQRGGSKYCENCGFKLAPPQDKRSAHSVPIPDSNQVTRSVPKRYSKGLIIALVVSGIVGTLLIVSVLIVMLYIKYYQ